MLGTYLPVDTVHGYNVCPLPPHPLPVPSPSLSPSPLQSQGKAKGDIHSSPRAMAKLLKEAQGLKVELSANTEHVAQVCVCVRVRCVGGVRVSV